MRNLIVLWVLIFACSLTLADYYNISNAPFNTITNGPQNALIVDVKDASDSLEVSQALSRAMESARAQWEANCSPIKKAIDLMYRKRLLKSNWLPQFDRLIILRTNGELLLPDLKRTPSERYGGGKLTFSFDGWTGPEKVSLITFTDKMYPIIKSVYGEPALDITVKIVKDPTLYEMEGATYNVSTNELRIREIEYFPNFSYFSYVLTHMLIHAFHDDLIFYYDAWEEGFARAATMVCQKIHDPSFDIGKDPFYLMPLYDCLNQAPLGNSTFFPPSGYQGMSWWRYGLSGCAWLKAYIENPNFFKEFNNSYYSQYNSSLPGNVPLLKQIALNIVPMVEGTGFLTWFANQYVLDTRVATGQKLFVYNLTQNDRSEQGVVVEGGAILILNYYTTSSDGNEFPLGGTAHLEYWNFDYSAPEGGLYAEEGNEVEIPSSGSDAGWGFISPTWWNIGGAQRVSIEITLGGIWMIIYIPYGRRGPEGNENNLYGVMGQRLGAESGTVEVSIDGGPPQSINVEKGDFGQYIPGAFTSLAKITLTYTDPSDKKTIKQVNAAFDYYVVLFSRIGERKTLTRQFQKGYSMISLPLTPIESDNAAALGIPPDQILLARWKPEDTKENKYHFYPDVPAFLPGLGYWLRLREGKTIEVEGIATVTDGLDYYLRLPQGWNQIGNPFEVSISAGDIKVKYGEKAPVSLSQAQGSYWVGRIWRYNPETSAPEPIQLTEPIEPWEGYWLKVFVESVILIIPAPKGRSLREVKSLDLSPVTPSIQNWEIGLCAQIEKIRDRENRLGVKSEASDGLDPAYDIEEPPPLRHFVTLYFPHSDWSKGAGNYAVDMRSPVIGSKIWRLEVSTDLPNKEVILTWDLRRLPKQYRPQLIDLDANRSIYMRTTSSYSYNSGESAGIRHFNLVVDAHPPAPLVISNINLTRAGDGLNFSYNLSAPAEINAKIISLTGRTVRTLALGREAKAGINQLFWNYREDSGGLVLNGPYILQIIARTDEGQSVRAAKSFIVLK